MTEYGSYSEMIDALCRAVGQDAAKIRGFELQVWEGSVDLTVWPVPLTANPRDGYTTDIADGLEQVQYRLVPADSEPEDL